MSHNLPPDWFSDQSSIEIHQKLRQGEFSLLAPSPKEDCQEFENICLETRRLVQELNPDALTEVVIYGAGQWGKFFFEAVFSNRPDTKVIFCDRNAHKMEMFCYCDVISPQELSDNSPHLPVFVATKDYQEEIAALLEAQQIQTIYYLWLESPKAGQRLDVTLPQLEETQTYVWLGNTPHWGRCYQLFLSATPFCHSPTENELFQFMPHLYSSLLSPLESSHYVSHVLPASYHGNLLTKESVTPSYTGGPPIDLMDLDHSLTLYALFSLKVSLHSDTLSFFQNAMSTISSFHPKLSIVFPLDETTLDQLEELLFYLKSILTSYEFTLSITTKNTLMCYGTVVKKEKI